jgi:hypothetical protein
MKSKLLISGLAFMALTTLAGAQNTNMPSSGLPKGTGSIAFNMDANKSKGTDARTGCPMGRMQQQGCGMGMRQGMGQGMGKGKGQGMCNGTGQCKGGGKNFVDSDNNGVCDNFEAAAKK